MIGFCKCWNRLLKRPHAILMKSFIRTKAHLLLFRSGRINNCLACVPFYYNVDLRSGYLYLKINHENREMSTLKRSLWQTQDVFFLKEILRHFFVFYEPSIRRNLAVEVSGSCYVEVLGSIKLVRPTPTFS
jgi:hypothetical protein